LASRAAPPDHAARRILSPKLTKEERAPAWALRPAHHADTSAYLVAVYLAADAARDGEQELERKFRRRGDR
jgi:hypothetical protein